MTQEREPGSNPQCINFERLRHSLQISFSEQTWAGKTLTLVVSRAHKPQLNNLWLFVAAILFVEALAVAGAVYYVDQRISNLNHPIILIDPNQGYI